MHPRAAKVVVTGGAGFVGSHLVDRLVRDTAAEIVVLDDLRHGRREHIAPHTGTGRVRLVTSDICDAAAVDRAIQGSALVYHLAAAPAGRPQADVTATFISDLVGTLNVLNASVAHGVRRVIFASSHEVYGRPIGLPVDESYPLLSVSLEGAMKVAGEALCRAFRDQLLLDVAILRLAKVYGSRDTGSDISVWVKSAEEGSDLQIPVKAEVADVVWVGQVVDALFRAGTIEGPLPPINVGSGTGTPFLALAKRIARLAGNGSRVTVTAAPAAQVPRFIASVDRMRELLDVEPLVDPLDHLQDLLRDGSKQPRRVPVANWVTTAIKRRTLTANRPANDLPVEERESTVRPVPGARTARVLTAPSDPVVLSTDTAAGT